MHCPDCHNELVLREVFDTMLHRCPAGHGTWVLGERLGYILHKASSHVSVPYAQISEIFGRHVHEEREEHRPCPACAEEMTTCNYGYNSNIFINRCDRCEGIWITSREFDRLVQYTKGNPKIDILAEEIIHLPPELPEKQNTVGKVEAEQIIETFRAKPPGWKGEEKEGMTAATKGMWLVLLMLAALLWMGIIYVKIIVRK